MSAVDRLLTRVGGVRLESAPRLDDTRRKLLEDALEFYSEILQEEQRMKTYGAKSHWPGNVLGISKAHWGIRPRNNH